MSPRTAQLVTLPFVLLSVVALIALILGITALYVPAAVLSGAGMIGIGLYLRRHPLR
jgi:hypothetical protein